MRNVVWYGLFAGLALSGAAMASEFKKAADCVVGQRVMDRNNQAGVIVATEGTNCRVRLDGSGKQSYYLFWMLRPAGAGAGASAGGATGVATGLYKCYMLAGTQLNYAFIDIRITGADRYSDKNGQSGSYRVQDGGRIVFTGPLAAANAKLLTGGRIGLNMNGGSFYNTTCNRA